MSSKILDIGTPRQGTLVHASLTPHAAKHYLLAFCERPHTPPLGRADTLAMQLIG